MTIRSGIGFDAHRFAENRRLVLGGVCIEHEFGLAGHSDADVLCHAISDALLGSVGEGDIGSLFPDSDSRWEGADSLEMLADVGRLLTERRASVVNVDATVIAETPKLGPYVTQMRQNIAQSLLLGVGAVSVKATTVEGMAALGRGEGIAAMAVVSIDRGE